MQIFKIKFFRKACWYARDKLTKNYKIDQWMYSIRNQNHKYVFPECSKHQTIIISYRYAKMKIIWICSMQICVYISDLEPSQISSKKYFFRWSGFRNDIPSSFSDWTGTINQSESELHISFLLWDSRRQFSDEKNSRNSDLMKRSISLVKSKQAKV